MARIFIVLIIVHSLLHHVKAIEQPAIEYKDTEINMLNPERLYHPDSKINWVTFEDLDKMLGKAPVDVGFDLDDTLVTTPIIFKFKRQYNAMLKTPPKNPSHPVWTAINCDAVEYTVEKEIGKRLIDFHKKRGDRLYFITAREKSPCLATSQYTINNFIEDVFSIKLVEPVIFTGFASANVTDIKTAAIKKHNIKVFYGDSDHDIADAHSANAIGVRVLRSASSFRKGGNNVGIYQEPVLVSSHY